MIRFLGREILASALSQRVTSLVTVLLMMGATATVLVTAGRNAGSEAAVLSQIDAVGTRTLSVYAHGEQDAFTSAAVAQLEHYDVVSEVVGFGPVQDTTSAANPQGNRVGMRAAYGSINGRPLHELGRVAGHEQVWATTSALGVLGMADARGTITAVDGPEYVLTSEVTLPPYLGDLEPAIIRPQQPTAEAPLAKMVIVADTPQDLPLVTQLVQSALADVPRDGRNIESSQAFADLRGVIGGELTRQSRGIIIGVLLASTGATLLAAWALALMRRRDFGRRRALGATRATIVTLVVGQVALLATLGALLGSLLGLAALAAGGNPRPAPGYDIALSIALVTVAALASAVPAVWASRRDPLIELRVP